MLHYLLTHFSPTILVATLLLATALAQQSGSPLLFLPAGAQLLAGFVYGLRSLPGCTLGLGLSMSLLAHHPLTAESITLWLLYSALSTLCLVGLIHLVCQLGHVNDALSGLTYPHILAVVILQAICDAALRTTLIPVPEHAATAQFLIQASGNLLGSMAVVFTIFIVAAWARQRNQRL